MNDEDREFIEKCEEPLIVVLTKSDKGVLGAEPLGEGVASNEVRARGRLPPPSL